MNSEENPVKGGMMEEPISFYSEKMRIRGNLHLPRENAPCVVTLHGLESHKDVGKWPAIASRLHENGYACLRFNFRGCGEGSERSEGEFEDSTLTARIRDYRSALEFLKTQRVDIHRLGVLGSSFGGMVALAAKDRRVKAAVLLATPYQIPRFEGLKGFYEDLQGYDLLEAARASPPLLIVHGSLDELVPVDHARLLYENVRGPKRLEIIEGADHVFSNPEHLDKVMHLAFEWFRKYLV